MHAKGSYNICTQRLCMLTITFLSSLPLFVHCSWLVSWQQNCHQFSLSIFYTALVEISLKMKAAQDYVQVCKNARSFKYWSEYKCFYYGRWLIWYTTYKHPFVYYVMGTQTVTVLLTRDIITVVFSYFFIWLRWFETTFEDEEQDIFLLWTNISLWHLYAGEFQFTSPLK